jgi:hypothetical protein
VFSTIQDIIGPVVEAMLAKMKKRNSTTETPTTPSMTASFSKALRNTGVYEKKRVSNAVADVTDAHRKMRSTPVASTSPRPHVRETSKIVRGGGCSGGDVNGGDRRPVFSLARDDELCSPSRSPPRGERHPVARPPDPLSPTQPQPFGGRRSFETIPPKDDGFMPVCEARSLDSAIAPLPGRRREYSPKVRERDVGIVTALIDSFMQIDRTKKESATCRRGQSEGSPQTTRLEEREYHAPVRHKVSLRTLRGKGNRR